MRIRLVPSGVDPTEALIYLWEITDRQTGEVIYGYVGKAKEGAGRPLSDYKLNVRNLLERRHYRKGKAHGFREVHRQLAKAVKLGQGSRFGSSVMCRPTRTSTSRSDAAETNTCSRERRSGRHSHRSGSDGLIVREPGLSGPGAVQHNLRPASGLRPKGGGAAL